MRKNLRADVVLAAAFAALGQTAFAHPLAHSHVHAPFLEGLAHPWLGFDHLAAMAAVGIWAAQLGGTFRFKLPAAFLTSMMIGALLGIRLGGSPFVEATVLCTVIGLGLAIGTALRPDEKSAVGAVLIAGFLHGYAHGGEAAPGAAATMYFSGFLLATTVLHAAGLAFASAVLRAGSPRAARVVRGTGFAVAAFGAALALGLA